MMMQVLSTFQKLVRNGMSPAVSVNKSYISITVIAIVVLQQELLRPEGTKEGNNFCHLAAISLCPLPTVSLEKTRNLITQDTDPR